MWVLGAACRPLACLACSHPPPPPAAPCQCLPTAGSGSDEEMAEAGPMGAASDAEDGDDDELLREWSRRLVA